MCVCERLCASVTVFVCGDLRPCDFIYFQICYPRLLFLPLNRNRTILPHRLERIDTVPHWHLFPRLVVDVPTVSRWTVRQYHWSDLTWLHWPVRRWSIRRQRWADSRDLLWHLSAWVRLSRGLNRHVAAELAVQHGELQRWRRDDGSVSPVPRWSLRQRDRDDDRELQWAV